MRISGPTVTPAAIDVKEIEQVKAASLLERPARFSTAESARDNRIDTHWIKYLT